MSEPPSETGPDAVPTPEPVPTQTTRHAEASRNQPSRLAPVQLRRRRRESWRVVPLGSGHAAGLVDPWHYAPPSDGYEQAALHLLECGLLPAPDRDGLRAMWAAGAEVAALHRSSPSVGG